MATSLFNRLIDIAKNLKSASRKVRWVEIIAALRQQEAQEGGGLTERQRQEAERIGLEKIAKWAAKVAVPSFDDFGWGGGTIPAADDGRIAALAADIAHYDWAIDQIDKAIAGFTRRRAKLVAEREAAIKEQEKYA